MGLAVFLMWIPALAAIIAGCISQLGSNGAISCKMLLNSIGFRKASFRWDRIFLCNSALVYWNTLYHILDYFTGKFKP